MRRCWNGVEDHPGIIIEFVRVSCRGRGWATPGASTGASLEEGGWWGRGEPAPLKVR